MKKLILFTFLIISCTEKSSKGKFEYDGYLPNRETAIIVAKAVSKPIYGDIIDNEEPLTAKLTNDSIWVVEGTSSGNNKSNGGVLHVELNAKTCEIIKIIHGK